MFSEEEVNNLAGLVLNSFEENAILGLEIIRNMESLPRKLLIGMRILQYFHKSKTVRNDAKELLESYKSQEDLEIVEQGLKIFEESFWQELNSSRDVLERIKSYRVIEEDAEFLMAHSPHYLERYYFVGDKLHKFFQLEETAYFYETTLKLKPDHSQAAIDLALFYRQTNRLEEAITILTGVSNHGDMVVQKMLGDIYLKNKKDPKLALRHYQRSIQANAKSLDAPFYEAGKLLYETFDKKEEGLAILLQGCSTKSNSNSYYRPRVNPHLLYYTGKILLEGGEDVNKVRGLFDRSLSSFDENIPLLETYLQLEFQEKQFLKARKLTRQILLLDEENTLAIDLRKKIKQELKK